VNDKQLKGLRVITMSDGQTLGTVERAYLDPAAKRIVGFSYTAGGGFLQAESSPMIDAEDVDVLDADGLILADPAAVSGRETARRYVDLLDLHELANRPVITEGGKALGHVTDIEFDDTTFELTELRTSAGLFSKSTAVPADRILTIGGDVIVVLDDAPAADGDAVATPPAATEIEPFQEQTFEIPLRRQELVVEKQVRLAEEVVLSKEAFARGEPVAGTVRREEVHLTERTTADAATTAATTEDDPI